MLGINKIWMQKVIKISFSDSLFLYLSLEMLDFVVAKLKNFHFVELNLKQRLILNNYP
ncbi:unnamed protein product [Paramecium octaurelia]|uniref:Uncharacterized protein n=1 Tax=Paramecium octaurelia TaxID=43137 RepID=A0A8S1V482_PAROT|nr:unnamed protein product [Paramecium octaurelia]